MGDAPVGFYRKTFGHEKGLQTWPWKKVEKRYGTCSSDGGGAGGSGGCDGGVAAEGNAKRVAATSLGLAVDGIGGDGDKHVPLFRVDVKLLALVRGIAKVAS
eukprot:COSAG05_NODE_1015_length_6188_cov_162.395139_1_plen_102_part_10